MRNEVYFMYLREGTALKESEKLKRRFAQALFALLCALIVATATTMAWYLYTTNAHTTKLHMAAGTNVELQISNTHDEGFSSSVALEKFNGRLNPVSTNRIQSGFQKVQGFIGSSNGSLLANLFKKSMEAELDYYKTTLYFRTNGEEMKVYLANIGFTDSDENNPISSAIRVGFVVPSTGEEYIFSITDKKNPNKQYNTFNGFEGCVLDASKTDGSVVEFAPLDDDNCCLYDNQTGRVTLKENSTPLCTVEGNGNTYGEPVEMNVYIWLEGCDEDCMDNIGQSTLTDIALSFAGYTG